MNTFTITLTGTAPTENTVVALSPPNYELKGTTEVTLNMQNLDETAYTIMSIRIDWGDDSNAEVFTKDVVKNYMTTSILDEMLYGKLNGSVATAHSHVYQYSGDGTYDNAIYDFTIQALYENGYTLTFNGTISIFRGSFYDSVDRLALHTTQILPVKENYTVVNLEGNNGYTLIGVLSA